MVEGIARIAMIARRVRAIAEDVVLFARKKLARGGNSGSSRRVGLLLGAASQNVGVWWRDFRRSRSCRVRQIRWMYTGMHSDFVFKGESDIDKDRQREVRQGIVGGGEGEGGAIVREMWCLTYKREDAAQLQMRWLVAGTTQPPLPFHAHPTQDTPPARYWMIINSGIQSHESIAHAVLKNAGSLHAISEAWYRFG